MNMKNKITIVLSLLLLTFCGEALAQSRSINRGHAGGADVGYLIRTFLKASKNPNFSIPYDLYRGNRSLTVDESGDPSRHDSDNPYVYGYRGKITSNGRYLNLGGLYKTWNIVLSGPHAGAILLELNSLEIDGRQESTMKSMVVNSVPCKSLLKHNRGSYYDAYLYNAANGYVMIYFDWGASAEWMTIYASGDRWEINRVWNENVN